MKRFYCTVCRKMKRVQKWPIHLQNVNSIDPLQRVGECNRHSRHSNQVQQLRVRKVGA